MNNILKTAINSVYGLSSASFPNPFNDPRNKDNMSVTVITSKFAEATRIKDAIDAYRYYYYQKTTSKKAMALDSIKRVIFNDPATIVLWADGTKTVVKCAKNETFDPEKGLAMAIAKKALGNEGWYYDIFKAYLPKDGGEK